uniref:Catenin alpha 3 n=1 Tax=Chlorocebus sabaeus TaxID=60711 RepID=A0A0D9R557_CHLSB
MTTPPEPQAATLGSALDELENLIVLNPLTVTEEEIRPSLEKRLEAIISGAALLADSSCTRDFHRERIIAECNAIRQALQDLLSEYMNNVGDLFALPSLAPLSLYFEYMLRYFPCTKQDKLQMSM